MIVDASNTAQAPYDLGDGTVFLVGIEYNSQSSSCNDGNGSGLDLRTDPTANCVDPLLQIINSCEFARVSIR